MIAGRWPRAGFSGVTLGLALLSAGCAANNAGGGGAVAAGAAAGVDVTRFHLGNDPARGEIAIEPLDGAAASGPAFGQALPAVERELSRLGWRVVRGSNRSEQVALVRVAQGAREIRRGRAAGAVVTELSVRLQRRSDGTAIWEGRAQGQARAGTPQAQPGVVADRLARALFAGFPGESGRTIRVR